MLHIIEKILKMNNFVVFDTWEGVVGDRVVDAMVTQTLVGDEGLVRLRG